MKRREFLKALTATAAAVASPHYFRGQGRPIPQTYSFKKADGCELKADVYGADVNVRKPVIVSIHGGALITGSREGFPGWLDPEGKYVIVSIDYRLAPTTKLPGIISDIQDACRWVHEQGPQLFHIDPEKLAVAGGSAGGYLSLMSGFCVTPRPRAVLALSGYGDLTASWITEPSPFYLKKPLVSKEEAYAAVGTACVCDPGLHSGRGLFYTYTRQKGIWPYAVSGHDPKTERKWFDPYCPVRNVSAQYPPTVLIHGTADSDVSYTESVNMDAELSRFKVEHEFLSVPGGPHVLGGFDPTEKARILGQGVDFLKKHLT
jgi:acetyl esterase/lipase